MMRNNIRNKQTMCQYPKTRHAEKNQLQMSLAEKYALCKQKTLSKAVNNIMHQVLYTALYARALKWLDNYEVINLTFLHTH